MARTYRQLDLDVQLCFPLYAATRAVTKRYADLLSDSGLTYPQYLVMLVLWQDAPLSVGELGERLRLDSGTLTPLLKRLETAGHISRQRDAADERRVIVEPTEQGWSLREVVSDVPLELLASLDLSEREAETLRRTLGKLLDHLDADEVRVARESRRASTTPRPGAARRRPPPAGKPPGSARPPRP